jgi:Smg protein
MTNAIPVKNNAWSSLGYRMYSENEQKKISAESLGFVLFLEQAKVLDPNEREIILDRAMALKQEHINIEEMRWIVMMALWNEGREKDFLFIEDAIYQDHNLVLH